MDKKRQREDLCAVRSIAVLIALVLGLGYPSAAGAQQADEAQRVDDAAAREWATEVYEGVVNEIFGRPTSAEPLPMNDLWRVTARVRPAYDEAEFQLSLTQHTDGTATAVLTRLPTALVSQLQRIYRERPTPSRNSGDVAQIVKVERIIVASTDWPALQKIVASFEALRSAVLVQNAMVVDPRQYQLWIDGGSQQVYFNLLGPSSGRGTHPIVQWIETASRQLEGVPRPTHRKE